MLNLELNYVNYVGKKITPKNKFGKFTCLTSLVKTNQILT